ncbi:MAG: glycosyltransferase [Acidobacteria bacterium]|nr:glycosyltransferase [Acidobacteriota bacterium]
MRVAIVHYWLVNMRGGEKVIEALCRLFPEAELFTLFYEPDRVSPLIRSRRVTASFLNPLRKHYRAVLPLMPLALESFDLRKFDLVISSESGPAKGIVTSASTRHICYCHTPMRYLWDLYPDYLHEWTSNPLKRAAIALFGNYLRIWDYAASARVDNFIANSANVQRRIQKAYRRESTVIHPPVDVAAFSWQPAEDYYLIVSELVAYKRIELALRVCSRMGRRLVVVGDGPERRRLSALTSSGISFRGRVSDEELRGLYSRCRALIVPGEEDFGITAVEALASGKPVVALGRGGVLEIATVPGAGYFFDEPSESGLESALIQFEESEVDREALQAHASQFSEEVFREKVSSLLLTPG